MQRHCFLHMPVSGDLNFGPHYSAERWDTINAVYFPHSKVVQLFIQLNMSLTSYLSISLIHIPRLRLAARIKNIFPVPSTKTI